MSLKSCRPQIAVYATVPDSTSFGLGVWYIPALVSILPLLLRKDGFFMKLDGILKSDPLEWWVVNIFPSRYSYKLDIHPSADSFTAVRTGVTTININCLLFPVISVKSLSPSNKEY